MPKSAKRYRTMLAQLLWKGSESDFLGAELEVMRLPVAKEDHKKRAALIRELRTLREEALDLRDRVRQAANTLENLSLSQMWMPEREEPKRK